MGVKSTTVLTRSEAERMLVNQLIESELRKMVERQVEDMLDMEIENMLEEGKDYDNYLIEGE